MSRRPFANFLQQVRTLVVRRSPGDESDGGLLERFVNHHDQAAFEAIIQRHGPLVLGTCRRILRDGHGAEDAFQATFLILFRRAGSLDRRGSLSGWLYGVAYRVALRARAQSTRWRANGEGAPEMADHTEPGGKDLRDVLDCELQQLPDKYRRPLVLCHLEGKTHEEAARALGWPRGSLAKRLARAQELLRGRLVRRGVALGSGALAAWFTEQATAAVSVTLVQTTLQRIGEATAGKVAATASVTLLVEGVLNEMFYKKFFVVPVVLLVLGLTGTGIGFVVPRLFPGEARAVPLESEAKVPKTWPVLGDSVLDPTMKALFLRTGPQEMSAFDLETGKLLWKSEKAFLPLAGLGNRVLALGADEGFRILMLDGRSGEVSAKSDALPAGVWIREGPTKASTVRARLEKDTLTIRWRGHDAPFGGANRPTVHHSGEAEVDVQTGKVNIIRNDENKLVAGPEQPLEGSPKIDLPEAVRDAIGKLQGKKYIFRFDALGPRPPTVPPVAK